MHVRFFALGGLALAAVIASACSSTNDASSGSSSGASSGGGGASSQQVDACKEGCNKMKFFGCNSAEEQATCYDQCTKATPAQIELFTACAQTSICDPACRTNITPKPPAGQPPAKGTGATPSSCATACDKLVSCSYVKVGEKAACVSVCEKEAYQYQIDCVNNNACDKLPSACGGTGGTSSGGTSSGGTSGGAGDPNALSIADCQSSCDQLLSFDCFSAAEQAACRASCTSKTTAKRDAFSSCAKTAGGECSKANACYSAFKG